MRAQLGDTVTVERIAGAERAATAAALSRRSPPDADTAVITGGGGFADAVAGGPLAAGRGAPLLLVGRDDVPTATAEALSERSLREVLVVGGSAVVGDGVLDELRALTGAEVRRIAGADRFATATAVSADTYPAGAVEVVLATGRAFPDTLAAGAAAAFGDGPLLLTELDTLPEVVAEELRRLRPRRVTVVGGPAAVSDGVVEAVRAAITQPDPDPPPPPPPPAGSAPGSLELIVARDVERCEPGGECFTRPELIGTAADGSAERSLVGRPPRALHYEAAWRPDGGAFAYPQDGGAWVAAVDGDEVGEPVRLRSVDVQFKGPCSALDWSADGSRLLMMCGGGTLLVDVAQDRVVASGSGSEKVFMLSDGRAVALRRVADEPSQLVLLAPTADGTFDERVVSDDPGAGREVVHLAVLDDTAVVLAVGPFDGGDADLLVVSLEDGSIRELADLPAPVSDLDVSPDGASVAVALQLDAAGGAVVAVQDGSTAFVRQAPPSISVAWRADGASLALSSFGTSPDTRDVIEVTLDARVVRTLVEDVAFASPVEWRPPR